MANINIEFVQEDCASCGMVFMVTKAYQARKAKDHTCFYCPDGHCMIYLGETEEARLRRVVAEKNALLAARDAEIEKLTKKRTSRKKKTA